MGLTGVCLKADEFGFESNTLPGQTWRERKSAMSSSDLATGRTTPEYLVPSHPEQSCRKHGVVASDCLSRLRAIYHRFHVSDHGSKITCVEGAKGFGSKPPSVFISWAHRDSKMTKLQAATWWQQVRALGERLNSVGCDVRLDMFTPDADWSRWGPEMIDESDFTLLVPNRAYRQRWDGRNSPREGAGAAREINTLKGRFERIRKSSAPGQL
jgi:hypothetical protein